MVIGFIYLRKNFHSEYIIERWKQFRINRKLRTIRNKQKKIRVFKEQVNSILDKINKIGYEHLTEEEKKVLRKASIFLLKEEGEKYQN
jgi:biopolymer transport protein ExbB/TolQ